MLRARRRLQHLHLHDRGRCGRRLVSQVWSRHYLRLYAFGCSSGTPSSRPCGEREDLRLLVFSLKVGGKKSVRVHVPKMFAHFLVCSVENPRKSLVNRKNKEHNTCVMTVPSITCSKPNLLRNTLHPSVFFSCFCSEVPPVTTMAMMSHPLIWHRSSEPSSFSSTGSSVCCPHVVDSYTWVALLGGVVLATYFLRLAILNNISRRRKRRALLLHEGKFLIWETRAGGLWLPADKRFKYHWVHLLPFQMLEASSACS